MWIEGNGLFEKEQTQDDASYRNVLMECGIEGGNDIDDIATKFKMMINLDDITTIVESKLENVTEITVRDGRYFYLDVSFDRIKEFIDADTGSRK